MLEPTEQQRYISSSIGIKCRRRHVLVSHYVVCGVVDKIQAQISSLLLVMCWAPILGVLGLILACQLKSLKWNWEIPTSNSGFRTPNFAVVSLSFPTCGDIELKFPTLNSEIPTSKLKWNTALLLVTYAAAILYFGLQTRGWEASPFRLSE